MGIKYICRLTGCRKNPISLIIFEIFELYLVFINSINIIGIDVV